MTYNVPRKPLGVKHTGVSMSGSSVAATNTGSKRKDTVDTPRERILDTATRLFYRNGVTNTGVDTVAKVAKVAKMTMYRQFGSKSQLVVECLDRLDIRYHDWFVAQVENSAVDPHDKLLAVFDVLDDWFHSLKFRGCAFINATVELADSRHLAKGPVQAHKRRNREYIQELAEQCDLPDPQALARQIMLLVEGSIITALVQRDVNAARDAKQAARTLLDR